ncbi:acetyltransferase GNAT family [Penicillium manginii]|uniref:acetyltransferase GNAT family n=1 Tax=Penicillium manginii TaxID=203109 RepID=UPI0025475178|nr:acetyltransferase GNAT family [Penicillium manginii]KAJ5767516.1 acetyltransferase GNAT family [Penicillium manginii]
MSEPKEKDPTPPPTLSTTITTTEKDLTTALILISTSITEQRQTTSRALIHSTPFISTVLGLIIPLALITEYYRLDRVSAAFTCIAIIAAAMKSVEFITAGYLDAARDIGWGWLYSADDENEDKDTNKEINIVFVSQWKDSMVGTLVLRVYPAPTGEPITHKRKPLIRAWTVKQAYRRNGVGRSLLRLAITHCRSSGWADPDFATDHANCLRVLPGWLYGGVEFERESCLGGLGEGVGC